MRREQDDNFCLIATLPLLREQVSQYRNVFQAGKAVERCCLVIGNEAAQNICFTFHQPDFMLYLTIREYGLRYSSDVAEVGNCANLNLHRHGYFTIEKHARRDVEVHTDINELKIDNGRSGRANECRLKTSRCNRDLGPDADRGQLSIRGAYRWILDQFGLRALRQKLSSRRWDSDRETAAVDVLQSTQGYRIACCGVRGRRGPTCCRRWYVAAYEG